MKTITKIVAGIILATIAIFVPTIASADGQCVPMDAWTETIEHPAVGNPTVTVDNPDYVPAAEGSYTTEPNPNYVPATPDTTVVTGYMKWNWTGGKKEQPVGPPPASGWHQVGVTSDSKGNTPDTILHQGNGNGSWFYFETLTEVRPGTPAQGEPTIQVWHEGTPAVGTPTIEVPNPDYKDAWTEKIEHPAVTCPVDPDPAVTADAPTFIDATCDGADAKLVIPDIEGVSYLQNDEYQIDDMTIPVSVLERNGDISVIIIARDVKGNELGRWTHTYTLPKDCGGPEVPAFQSGTDFTCNSFSFWHNAYYNAEGAKADSYEYTVEGAVTDSKSYTEPGFFEFHAASGSKIGLTVKAVFGAEKVTIIERVYVLPPCVTPPATDSDADTDGNSGGPNPGGPQTGASGSSDVQGTSGTGADGNTHQEDTAKPAQYLAVTGGSDTTMYIVTAGVALAVLGALVAGFAIMRRRERKDSDD